MRRPLLNNLPAHPFQSAPAARPACRAVPRGEKIPHGGGLAVLQDRPSNFFGPGGGLQRSPRECRPRGRAQASGVFRPQAPQFPRRFLLISAAVLRLWQLWHKLWRLSRSMNSAQSPRWSTMWSTSVALTLCPCWAQILQNGSRMSCIGRKSSRQMSVPYIQRQDRACALRRSSAGLWRSQYPDATRARHPGWRHGRSGLCARAITSCNAKTPGPDDRTLSG